MKEPHPFWEEFDRWTTEIRETPLAKFLARAPEQRREDRMRARKTLDAMLAQLEAKL